MIFTVQVEFPDQLAAEAIPLLAADKDIKLTKTVDKVEVPLSSTEVTAVIAQAIADEQIDRFKELVKRSRAQQSSEQFDQEVNPDPSE